MIPGIVASQQTGPTMWTEISPATQNATVSYSHTSGWGTCPSEAAVRSWLTSNYPPANYASGYIMRVGAYTDDFTFCQYFFYRAD